MANNDVRYVDQNGTPLTFGPQMDDLGGALRQSQVALRDTSNTKIDPATAQLQGALTETAPATDTASSGQNGRLQRIAQNLTSLKVLFPTSLGQKTSAASFPVVLPSDQGGISSIQSGTWTVQPGNTANTTAWKVDGSAVTQPVSGTFWPVTQPVSGTISATSSQSGTWTVQPGNTANTTAWKVDNSAVTQPISAVSLPLPTGAATAAGAGSIATAQVSVTTSSTQIVAVRSGRQAVTIINHGTTDTYIGVTGLTTSTGILLPGVAGASVTIPTSAAIFGRVAAGTQTVGVLETF